MRFRHTDRILVVAEAVHDGGTQTVPEVMETIAGELTAHWRTAPAAAVLTPSAPEFAPGGRPVGARAPQRRMTP